MCLLCDIKEENRFQDVIESKFSCCFCPNKMAACGLLTNSRIRLCFKNVYDFPNVFCFRTSKDNISDWWIYST